MENAFADSSGGGGGGVVRFALDSKQEAVEKVVENKGGHSTTSVSGSQVPLVGTQSSVAGGQASVAGSQVPPVGRQASVAGSQATARDEDEISGVSVSKERAPSIADDSGGQRVPEPTTVSGPQPPVATAAAKGDTTISTKGGRPPAARAKGGSTDKGTAVRSTSNESGGKASTGFSKDGTSKAIVEVLDRVDTPQFLSTSAAVVGDGGGGRNVAVGGSRNVGGGSRNVAVNDESEAIAFSVLPDGERNDDRPCECPDCRKKPKWSSSSKCCDI